SRRRHTRFSRDWSSDVCSSDLHWLWRWRRRVAAGHGLDCACGSCGLLSQGVERLVQTGVDGGLPLEFRERLDEFVLDRKQLVGKAAAVRFNVFALDAFQILLENGSELGIDLLLGQ